MRLFHGHLRSDVLSGLGSCPDKFLYTFSKTFLCFHPVIIRKIRIPSLGVPHCQLRFTEIKTFFPAT